MRCIIVILFPIISKITLIALICQHPIENSNKIFYVHKNFFFIFIISKLSSLALIFSTYFTYVILTELNWIYLITYVNLLHLVSPYKTIYELIVRYVKLYHCLFFSFFFFFALQNLSKFVKPYYSLSELFIWK